MGSAALFLMRKLLSVSLAALACVSLSSCQTLARTLQVPGNMMQSVGRSAGLASHEADPSSAECSLEPKFD